MRENILVTMFTILCIGLFFSCRKIALQDLTNEHLVKVEEHQLQRRPFGEFELKPEYFDRVGQAHNEGLDYVLEHTFLANPNTTCDDVNNAAINFVFNVNPDTKESQDDPNAFYSQEHKDMIMLCVQSPSIISNREFLLNKLTTAQFQMVERLDQVIMQKNTSLEERIEQIRVLEYDAIENLNDDEIGFFLSTTSLARYSLQYWDEKGDLWLEVIENENNSIDAIDWENVAKADIAAFIVGFPAGIKVGAIVGGLTAGIASAGITAGVGAVLGGIAGGTVSGLASAVSVSATVLAAEVAVSWWKSWKP